MAHLPDGSTEERCIFGCKPFDRLSGEVWSCRRPSNWPMFILVSTLSRASLGAPGEERKTGKRRFFLSRYKILDMSTSRSDCIEGL
jgi:hypothetical protein